MEARGGGFAKPELQVLAQQPGTGMVGSGSEGLGGCLPKNLKNKWVSVCCQVIHTRLKKKNIRYFM